MADNEITIRITAQDATGSALGSVRKELAGIDDVSQQATKSTGTFGAGLKNVASIAGGFVVGQALSDLPGMLMRGAEGAAEDAAAMTRLQQAVTNTGASYDTYSGQIEDVIAKGQDLVFSDGEIASSLSLLVSLTGSTEEGMKRLSVAQDLARGTGMGLEQASRLLGKVTDENISVLSRYGITVGKGATAQDLLNAVIAKFDGQAAAFAADEAASGYARYQLQMEELSETLGSAVLPVFGTLADVAGSAIEILEPGIKGLATGIGAFTDVLEDNEPAAIAAATAAGIFIATIAPGPAAVAGLTLGLGYLIDQWDAVEDTILTGAAEVADVLADGAGIFDWIPGVDVGGALRDQADAWRDAARGAEEYKEVIYSLHGDYGELALLVSGATQEWANQEVVIDGVNRTIENIRVTQAGLIVDVAATADGLGRQSMILNETQANAYGLGDAYRLLTGESQLAQAGTEGLAAAQGWATQSTDTLRDAIGNLTSSYGDNELASNNVALAALELQLAQMVAAGATDDETAAIRGQIDALNNSNDVLVAGQEFLDAYTTSLGLNYAQLGLNKTDADQLSLSVSGLGAMFTDAEGAVRLANDALFWYGSEADNVTGAMLTLAENLNLTVMPAINDVGQAVFTLPSGKTITIDANDLATSDLDWLQKYYLNDKWVSIYADTTAFWNEVNNLPWNSPVNPQPGPYGNADGTRFFEGGLTWVGEEGPELMRLPRGTRIWSNPESERMAAGFGGGGGTQVIQLVVDGKVLAEAVNQVNDRSARSQGYLR